jgi:hypothetical protein
MTLPPVAQHATEQIARYASHDRNKARQTRDLTLFKSPFDHEPKLIKLRRTNGKMQRDAAAHGRDKRLGPAQGYNQLGDLGAKA